MALRALHKAKGRREAGRHLLEGPRAIEAALAAGAEVAEVWTSPRLEGAARGPGLRARLEGPGAPEVVACSDAVLEALADTRAHQGAVAVCATPAAPDLATVRPGDLVVLADLQDPGNVGTIWRAAAAAGFALLVQGEGGADPWSPKALRAAAGASAAMPACRLSVDGSLLHTLRGLGYRLVATAATGAQRYDEVTWSEPVALVIGQEGPGLPPGLLEACDLRVRVPMAPGVESLNAAQCLTLLAYERARGRGLGALDGPR